MIAAADKLIAIGAFCIGTNQIDLQTCLENGIAVFNAPYSNTRSMGELIIEEIIMLQRDVFDKSMKLHSGVWNKSARGHRHQLKAKVVDTHWLFTTKPLQILN